MKNYALLVCCLSLAAGPALAAGQKAMTELIQSAGENASAPPPEAAAKAVAAPSSSKPDQAKIILRTGFYTTAALDCGLDVSMAQDGSLVYAAFRENTQSGASCSAWVGETATLAVDKADANAYAGRNRVDVAVTVKVVNETSFIGGTGSNLYTLARAADQADAKPAAPALCPYVHTVMRTDPRCRPLTFAGFISRWDVHCGDVPTVVTDMVPCDQLPR